MSLATLRAIIPAFVFVIACSAVSALISSNALIAVGPGAVPPLLACPQGYGFPDDGCGAAPAPLTAMFRQPAAFQPGGFFNTIAATPTNYMATDCGPSGTALCREPFNVAGVDYAIGPYTPLALLLDPAIPANLPTGCTYSIAAWGGGNLVCGGTGSGFTGTVAHLNRGPIGGHGCTGIRFNNTPGVTQNVLDDDYFFNDTGLCSNDTAFVDEINAQANGAAPPPLLMTNAYEDGNAAQFPLGAPSGGCLGGSTQCNPISMISYGTQVTIKYSYIAHFAGRTISVPVTQHGNYYMYYSMVDGWLYRATNGHGEWALGGGTGLAYGDFVVDHVVSLGHHEQSGAGEVPIFTSTSWPVSFGSIVATNDTIIDPWIGAGGLSGTVTGCFGGTFNGTNCVGNGNTFFVTALTGTLGVGQIMNCQSSGLPTEAIFFVSQLSGPGTGYLSSWSYDGSINGVGEFPSSEINAPAQNCNPASINAEVANNGFLTAEGSPVAVGEIENNYTDLSGMSGYPSSPNLYVMGGGASNITATIAGTAMVASGSQTLATGELIYAADVPGCSTGILSCLSVSTGGTALHFTLSGNASVGPETLEGFVNEASFSATLAGTALTTSTSQTLTAGDYVLGAATCGANPTSCPKIQTTATGTAFTLATSGGTVSAPTAMNTLRNTVSFNGTINNASPGAIASGNQLLPSLSLVSPEFINGAGVTGCSTGILSCPQIAGTFGQTITGTSFTLTTNGGSVGPEVMAATQENWCAAPFTVSGNVDMGGLTPDAEMNKLSGSPYNTGSPNYVAGCN